MGIRLLKIWLILPLVSLAVVLGYPLLLQAQTAPQGKTDLILNLVGAFPGNVTPGQENHFFLQVRNNGNVTVSNIRFSAVAPEDWIVNFQPERLDSLSAGSSDTIDVTVIPDRLTDSGDYSISVYAEASETRTATSIFLSVEGVSSYWLWVGVGITALVIIGFIVVFLRYGRQ